MTWIVPMCDCAKILSDFGVVVNEGFLDLPACERDQILRRGLALLNRALDLDVEYSPFPWRSITDADSFERALDDLERSRKIAEANKKAKRTHIARRRSEFGMARSSLVLQMLDVGMDYVCAVDGCGECEDLTIDHIKPVSRGGTDELINLQFMCRRHNSEKGAKV